MSDDIIRIRDAVVHAKGEVILSVSELCIKRGEQIILTGPSGSGKTTLLNLIAGLVQASQGTIEVDGVHLGHKSSEELASFRAAKIGYIFQNFQLLEDMTARQNITMPGMIFKRPDAEAEAIRLAQQLNVGLLLDRKVRGLSGGEKQRLAIVRALSLMPTIILADEPTASVGQTHKDVILEELCKATSNLIIVTHDTRSIPSGARVIDMEEIA